jgi:hypothetical protein
LRPKWAFLVGNLEIGSDFGFPGRNSLWEGRESVRGGLKTGKQGVSPPRGREIEAVLAIMGRFWAKWALFGGQNGSKMGVENGAKKWSKRGSKFGLPELKKGGRK